jgi:hypothetical protein
MSAINRIELRLRTGDRQDAGTDGDVFLGLAGREFNVDTTSEDFERGNDRTYIFGEGANVLRPPENDPRTPMQTDTSTSDAFPGTSASNPETAAIGISSRST